MNFGSWSGHSLLGAGLGIGTGCVIPGVAAALLTALGRLNLCSCPAAGRAQLLVFVPTTPRFLGRVLILDSAVVMDCQGAFCSCVPLLLGTFLVPFSPTVVHKNTPSWLPGLPLSPWAGDLCRDLVLCVQKGPILLRCGQNLQVSYTLFPLFLGCTVHNKPVKTYLFECTK